MKRWMKYFIVGVTVLLIFSMTGCGGVSHKSPEKVTEELINAYAKGKEKNVKDCYNEKKDTAGCTGDFAGAAAGDCGLRRAVCRAAAHGKQH